MGDWIYENLGWCILLLLSAFLCFLSVAFFRERDLMRDCMKDGHKEYECVGVIRGRPL